MTWYIYNLVYGFFSPANQDNQIQYEIGAAIFLGYVSCVLSLAAGGTCFCCPGPKEDNDFRYGGKEDTYNLRSRPTANNKRREMVDYI